MWFKTSAGKSHETGQRQKARVKGAYIKANRNKMINKIQLGQMNS